MPPMCVPAADPLVYYVGATHMYACEFACILQNICMYASLHVCIRMHMSLHVRANLFRQPVGAPHYQPVGAPHYQRLKGPFQKGLFRRHFKLAESTQKRVIAFLLCPELGASEGSVHKPGIWPFLT